MDNNTRIMFGLKNENISFPKDWLENVKIKEITAQVIKGSLTCNPNRCEKWNHKTKEQSLRMVRKQRGFKYRSFAIP